MTVRASAGRATTLAKGRSIRRRPWRWWLCWLPMLAGPTALVLTLTQLHRLAEAAHWNSDAAAPAIIVESIDRADGGTVLGEISSASTLFLFRATRALPDHRAVWDALPYLLAVIGVGLLAWVSFRLSGRWAAAITFAVGTCVSTDVLFTQIAPAFHGTTWLSVAVLLAFLVGLETGIPSRGWHAALAACLVGVFVGANVASDPLLLAVGLLPFAATAIMRWRRRQSVDSQRTARLALLTTSAAAVGAIGAVLALSAAGMTTSRLERGAGYLPLARPSEIIAHLGQSPYWVRAGKVRCRLALADGRLRSPAWRG